MKMGEVGLQRALDGENRRVERLGRPDDDERLVTVDDQRGVSVDPRRLDDHRVTQLHVYLS
ncbi:hypothetical protein [Streptomyces sp. MJM8645]|uniref:hypothetical protein n=1 Tax=Streptomycetaceae TaxID=2062 RepID=UPI0007AF594D|nr:hypothetical protein [Streptomyces sp. MJM8645]